MACSGHIARPHSTTPVCVTETYTPVALPCASHALDDDTCQSHSVVSACTINVANSGCSGHYAANTNCGVVTSTDSCPSYTADTGSSYYPWTDDPLSTSVKIKAEHHNQLRSAITIELSRRSRGWPVDPGIAVTSNKIAGTHVKNLRNGISAALAANIPALPWTIPTYLQDTSLDSNDKVQRVAYTALRNEVRYLENGCTCQCNYCTCDCFFCTCVCNYGCTCVCNYTCTCQCNYCTCVCFYSCTCNCAYSYGGCVGDSVSCTCNDHSPNGADG